MSFSKIIDGNRYLRNTLIFYKNHGFTVVERVPNFPPKNRNPTQNKNHKLKISREKSK